MHNEERCYWCYLYRDGLINEADLVDLHTTMPEIDTAQVKAVTVLGNNGFYTSQARWQSFGYVLATPAYGTLPAFVGGALGPSAYVPNN